MKANPPSFPPAEIIRHSSDLRSLVDRLRGEPLIGVDTESNSLYAYYEQVCLVQLSTREHDYIIDPLAVDDMSPLGELLADPAVETVFHAAEYDIMTMKRDFNFEFANIFDTMIAARICGWDQFGLGSILESHFGIRAEKRFQQADWAVRPLPAEQLVYAQMDTHYLPDLRDVLLNQLTAKNHLEEAQETFAALPELPAARQSFDPEGYWRMGHARTLNRAQMGLVRELYLLRDDIARRRDLPPFKIFNDSALVQIALLDPRRVEDLQNAKGLSFDRARRYGDQIIEAVGRGRAAPPPEPPARKPQPDPDVQMRYDALRAWRKERAARRGVESDVIVPRESLWALAKNPPASLDGLEQVPGLGPWRRAQYGRELLDVLSRTANGDDSDE
ncbi:MAG TPA: HRDC domain-containing protein [Aggregatilinea sp.]|uniref:ribonuclease D n=1 Tax=Aggregatilinea sp. TaxID=2806333 RepID=UPI002C5DE9F0|nr:HRDC domain-containing protein [Aggregatilinea sp.]HML24360.1 HRDC domain-containing protein [Aggregatilinea sp.]